MRCDVYEWAIHIRDKHVWRPDFFGSDDTGPWRNIQGLKDISLVLTLVIVNVSLFDGGKD